MIEKVTAANVHATAEKLLDWPVASLGEHDYLVIYASEEIKRLNDQVTSLQGANNREVERHSKTGVWDNTKEEALQEIITEYQKATIKFPRFNSAHEGFAVMWKEVDELWQEVKRNKATRSRPAMFIEAQQVAAMALRFMVECCGER